MDPETISNKDHFSPSKLSTEDTLIGLSRNAAWRVEEEWKHLQEPAPIPCHLTVEGTAVNLDQLKRQLRVTKKSAVSIFVTAFCWSSPVNLEIKNTLRNS